MALGDDNSRSLGGTLGSTEDRISCFNAISYYYHQVSSAETAADMYQKWVEERTKNLNLADYIHASSNETITTKTYYYITEGNLS